ncbi:putative Arylsulfatase [metagenome]|uniref:Putative Arylsulfatase n=1 Tax=metagenome TaxID=256318 RepID=A0A2P2CIV0_9ZZZZ
MPRPTTRPSRGTRLLAVTAIATLGAAALGACDSTAGPRSEETRHVVSRGPQPVPSPGPDDAISLTDPLSPQDVQTPRRPNLLMVTVDDAAFGDMRFMPHLQRLMVDQGVTLTNGIAPTPICVPARASLISGQYAHNHGALTIDGAGGGFKAFEDSRTLPVWLRRSGYDTMFVGKYLNGYGKNGSNRYVPPGWTDWRATVDPTTYNFVRPTINNNGTNVSHREYSTKLFSDLTHNLLSAPRRTKHPWYLWVNYVAPHVGGPAAADDPLNTHPGDRRPIKTTTPAKRDENTFRKLRLPRKPDMFENADDKAIIRATHRTWSPSRRQQLREARQQRVEALQAVDRALARTVTTLRRTHQLDNTYIVLTSDNGYVLGEHNLQGKLWYFREIENIPMYVRGPGLPRGVKSSTPVTNADWAPTFAALAGATPTRPMDGLDVIPWLRTGATTRVVPIEAYPVDGGRERIYSGVIVGPWTYVINRGGREELYYRKVDPWQINNLRRDARFRSQLKELRQLNVQYADCAASTCPGEFYR